MKVIKYSGVVYEYLPDIKTWATTPRSDTFRCIPFVPYPLLDAYLPIDYVEWLPD